MSKLIEQQYQRAVDTLKKNEDKLILLAEKLLKTEVIFKEDLELIFGKRVWDKELEEEIVPKPKKRAKKVVPPSDETDSTNA